MGKNYANMKAAELRAELKTRGLKQNGKVETLIQRLTEDDQKKLEKKIAESADAGIGVGSNSKKSYNFNAMRPALIAANEDNNRKAITADFAIENGVDEERFDQWKLMVETLYDRVDEYVIVKRDRTSDEKTRATMRQRIWPELEKVFSCGEETFMDKNMYVREDDVESVIGFCEDFMATALGTEQISATKHKFRKLVETLVGCRIKGCTTLPASDRDLIREYEKAVKSVNKNTTALEGDGKNNLGLRAELRKVQVSIAKTREELEKAGLPEATIITVTVNDRALEKTLRGQIKNAEKALKKAEATVTAKKAEAEVIYARINAR